MNDTDSTKALIARPEELSLELCLDAYRMFADAESRANADQHAYAADVNGFHAEIKGLVKTNDQKRICDHEVERYRQGYLKRFQDYLHALSWCQAPETTDDSARNASRLKWAGGKLSQFNDWRTRTRETIKAKVMGEGWERAIGNSAGRMAGLS